MLILVSGATKTVRAHPEIGVLVTPRAYGYAGLLQSRPWGVDNDCFNGFDEPVFLRMLDRLHARTQWAGCLFVAAPDVVAKASETLDLFCEWRIRLQPYRCPVALVAQDGMEDLELPWGKFRALFIGGSTHWKLSRAAANLVAYAKARGCWVHMGRVNTPERVRIAEVMGVDSFDGGTFSRWSDLYIPQGLNWIKDARTTRRPVQFSMLHGSQEPDGG